MFSKIQKEHISIAEYLYMWFQILLPLTITDLEENCKISGVIKNKPHELIIK